jgi:hypothetical protein
MNLNVFLILIWSLISPAALQYASAGSHALQISITSAAAHDAKLNLV